MEKVHYKDFRIGQLKLGEVAKNFFIDRAVEIGRGGVAKACLGLAMIGGTLATSGTAENTKVFNILSGLSYGIFGVACLMMIASYISEICSKRHEHDDEGIKCIKADRMFTRLFKILAVISVGFMLSAGISVAVSS